MKNSKTRLQTLEARFPQNDKPIFIGWIGDPWTEEQKKEAIRKNPECKFFWRSLSTTPPYEDYVKAQEKGREERRQ